MSYIHDLFNVTNDFELNKVLESLDLSYEDMVNIDSISNHNCSIQNKRNELLEYLAGTADGNYDKVKSQLSKVYKPRVLKEESGLNLNQVMELNQLIQMVAQKLDIEQCMTGVYNIIKSKTNDAIAKAFIGMAQQCAVNQSSLKFNTDINVGGQNLAQVIYQLKNEIEMFVNSIERPKEEKEEVKEAADGYSIENRLAGVYNIKNGSFRELASGEQHNLSEQDFINRLVRYGFQDTEDGKVCYITSWSYADAFNTRKALIKKYPNENVEKWRLEWFQNPDGSWIRPIKKYVEILDKNGRKLNEPLNEGYTQYKEIITQLDNAIDSLTDINAVQTILSKIDELMSRVKNMNEANDIAELKSNAETKLNTLQNGGKAKVEECCLATQVAANACGEDTFNGLLDGIKPTVINITVNKESNGILPCEDTCCCEPCCCEDNCCCNDECCCEPCEDMLPQSNAEIVQPMNFQPTAIDSPILRKPNSAEVTSAITALASHANDIKSDSRENNLENLQTINTLLGQISNYFDSLLNESVENEDEQLDEETVYDHSWYEVEGQKYPKRTKNGVEGLPIKEGIKDMFKKDTRQYRIEYGTNGGWISKDMKYIKGDIMDALIVTGYKKAQKLCDKLEPKQKNEKGLLHIEEIKHYPEEKDFEKTYEFLDIMKKYINREITSEEIKKYLKDKKIYTNINDYLILYKPSKIKNEKELEETCSARACCAASVATVPSKPKKTKPRKEKSFDVELFKESIQDDLPSTLTINGNKVSYKMIEGKGYLYINNGIVKTLDKDVMLETVDDAYNNCLDIEVLEGFNAYDLQTLLEDYVAPSDDTTQENTVITPAEKQKQQQELDNQINKTPNMKVGVVNDENPNEIKQNQEIVGVDDADMNNKKYIVKDPSTGDVKVASYDQIKVLEKI